MYSLGIDFLMRPPPPIQLINIQRPIQYLVSLYAQFEIIKSPFCLPQFGRALIWIRRGMFTIELVLSWCRPHFNVWFLFIWWLHLNLADCEFSEQQIVVGVALLEISAVFYGQAVANRRPHIFQNPTFVFWIISFAKILLILRNHV